MRSDFSLHEKVAFTSTMITVYSEETLAALSKWRSDTNYA